MYDMSKQVLDNIKTYLKEDGLFETMPDKSTLTLEHPEARENWVSKAITFSTKITVYNTKTKALSQKSIY